MLEKYTHSRYPFRSWKYGESYYMFRVFHNGFLNFRLSPIILGNLVNSGPGGVFSIGMIQCPDEPKGQLSEQIFYENGMLCEYLRKFECRN